MTRYRRLAEQLSRHIDQGRWPPGTRLPGVRRLAIEFGVSISTVVQALRLLEDQALVEARPRSGHYARLGKRRQPAPPSASTPALEPTAVTGQQLVLQLAHLANQDDFTQLGAAVPDAAFLPTRALQRCLSRVARHNNAGYSFPPGLPALRAAIADHLRRAGDPVDANDVLITNGCQEALILALRCVTRPGEIVAIESPTFYGLLQAIESLGLRALEIPTDPADGISPEALELALEQWPVKACVLMANFGNPLGGLLPERSRLRLLELARRHDLILIEDDVNGDLGFDGARPPPLHALDDADGQVIHCASFSKSISHGLRVGWMIPPRRLFARAEYLKYVTNLAAPTLGQMALAEFLNGGGMARHLRQMRERLRVQVERFRHALARALPEGARVTRPAGGFVLWVELDETVDSLALCHRLLARRISIAPGRIFSASGKYGHCLRLNCALPWTARVEQALIHLGAEAMR